MDFFKSGIKTVLGTSEPSQQPSAAETVEKLVDRVQSSTLLDDRRDACRALKALSRKYRVEVGAQGLDSLINVLQNDSQDAEIVTYSLHTLSNIMANDDFDEDDIDESPVNVGEQFTEMFIKSPENVTTVMAYLEEYDFRVRRAAIQLITTLVTNKTKKLQELVLVSPMGVSKLMDLLSDSREVIRNDSILLLIQLTKGNSNIQKIVAFENAFDSLFEIIRGEDCSDGGIVVEDCLILLLNLLKNNSSNQQFFREGSYIQVLASMFEALPDTDESKWTGQKVSNVHCMLQVIRALVAPSNQQQIVSTCQKVLGQTGLLDKLCRILMSGGVPADILVETIITVAEVVRGDQENQEALDKAMAPSNPPRPAIVVLLMSMINEKQLLGLRCAVLYAFQCYMFRNKSLQQQVVQTLLPSSVSGCNLSTGQLLCSGLFSEDALSIWFSTIALAHTLIDNTSQKEELLRVLLSSPGGQQPVTLLAQCTNLLQRENTRLQSKVGILILLNVWLSYCPLAVKALLCTEGTMAFLTAQISAHEHDENEYLIQGLCAFLICVCIHFNDNSLSNQNREDICQIIIKRIGQELFFNKLSEISKHEAYSRSCKQPQPRVKFSSDLLLDYEFCKLFKSLESLFGKLIADSNVNPAEITELTLNSEASTLVSQYKAIIRDQDSQIKSLQKSVNHLKDQNVELEIEIDQLKVSNIQISDQNILLKAQLAALQNGAPPHNNGVSNSSEALANNYQNTQLIHEIEDLRQRLVEEKRRADDAISKQHELQSDQENLLELLSEQEEKIDRYEEKLNEVGQLQQAE